MRTDTMSIREKIVNYWKEINLLIPVNFSSTEYSENISINNDTTYKFSLNDEKLETTINSKKCNKSFAFGSLSNNYLYKKVIPEKEIIDNKEGTTILFSFKIDEDGNYIENSFSVDIFFYLLFKNGGNINKKIKDEISSFNKDMNDIIYEKKLEIDIIENIIEKFFEKMEFTEEDKSNIEKSYFLKFESNDKKDPFLPLNFYQEDLENLSKIDLDNHNILKDIIYIPHNNEKDGIKIDTEVDEMKKVTMPKNIPLVKWPSKYNPSLMQGIAINIFTSDNYSPNVFSVNGPPGTGKTALLKEIIADTIFKKALNILKLKLSPNKLESCKIDGNEYFKIPKEIKSLGIIVASNNNAAVENISKELPKASDVKEEKTLTGLFDISSNNTIGDNDAKESSKSNDGIKNIYFTNLANKMFGNGEAWGMISALYGKQENVDNILKIFPGENSELNGYNFELNEIPDFEKVKDSFEKKYNEILNFRERYNSDIEQVYKNKEKIKEMKSKLILDEFDINLKSIKFEKEELENYKNKLKEEYKDYEIEIRRIENSYNIFTKIKNFIFGNNDERIKEKELAKDKVRIKQLILENEFIKFKYFKNDENKCLEEEFYKNILENDESQKHCPYAISEFNKKREELFYYSLKLIEAYISNSEGIKRNLLLLKKKKLDSEIVKECFHTLNLFIPVLSTTFASVYRRFKNFGENELGIVIIDEAGQATPFSALGLLYRASKCIIVGDPLQVEPVLTTPNTLMKNIAKKYGINEIENKCNYISPNLSIQTLADNANKYYGEISKIRVGCPLVVHRRCISPMFDISNKISYGERMINATTFNSSGKKFVLEKSEFINVKGKEVGNKNHYVKEQGEKVIEIINSKEEIAFEDKKLYIISPFNSVIDGLKKEFEKCEKFKDCEKFKNWKNNSIGTVHKFQGKEADSVILLLECDENSERSVEWAKNQPNILNVAATRAKYRFSIIGDIDLWADSGFYETAKNILKEKGEGDNTHN